MPTTPPASLESQRKSAVDEWDEDEFGNLVRKGKAKATQLPGGSEAEQKSAKLGASKGQAAKKKVAKSAKAYGMKAPDQPKDITKKKAE